MKNDPAYLSPKEAAAILGVYVDFVYHAVRDGRMPAVRIGTRTIRISREALDAWMRQHGTAK